MHRHLLKLHQWIGLVTALPLLILSVTGALLVYGNEIEARLAPAEWQVDGSKPQLPFEALLRKFSQQHPRDRVILIATDQPPGQAWKLWLADGRGLANIDPSSGQVLKLYQNHNTIYGWVLQFHRWLLIPDGQLRNWVRNGISTVTLLLILQLILGMAMWLAPPKRMQRLKIPLRGDRRLLIARLHSVSGIALSILLFVIALTGMSFNWYQPVKTAVTAATFSSMAQTPTLHTSNSAGPRDLDLAVAAAKILTPNGALQAISVPSNSAQPLNVRIMGKRFFNADRYAFDPVTGELLYANRAEDKNLAESFLGITYKLHTGDFAGPLVKALWLPLALMPGCYALSGVWLYWRRKREIEGAR